MAFIRTYSQRYQGQIMGDPFVGRLFKKIRKWQPGKTLRSIAAPALSLLPIPGAGLLSGAAARMMERESLPAPAPALSMFARIAARYGLPIQAVAEIAAQHGIADMGDPAQKKQRKRQGAKRSAQKKASGKGKRKSASRRPSGSKQSVDWGKIAESAASALPVAGQVAADLFKEMKRTGMTPAGIPTTPDLEDLIARSGVTAGAARGRMPRLPGMGGRRRTINPANVKALKRSMRRVEGFQTLVKRVGRMFPKLRPVLATSRRARGHRSGCRCAVCSR